MSDRFVIQTDTAAIAVFDPACLVHRWEDSVDWWSDPAEEIAELRRGNALVIGLGADGRYTVDVQTSGATSGTVRARVASKTGRLFVGPGEDIPGGGSEPSFALGGRYFELAPGVFEVGFTRIEPTAIVVTLAAVDGPASNSVEGPLKLPETE